MRRLWTLVALAAMTAGLATAGLAAGLTSARSSCKVAPKNAWTVCPHAHLAGRNLAGAHLRNANLAGADLSGADLASLFMALGGVGQMAEGEAPKRKRASSRRRVKAIDTAARPVPV